jgi:hypothetical protein
VLAGVSLSLQCRRSDPSAGEKVDRAWKDHVNKALRSSTRREPDEAMAAAGNSGVWRDMVEAAISQRID